MATQIEHKSKTKEIKGSAVICSIPICNKIIWSCTRSLIVTYNANANLPSLSLLTLGRDQYGPNIYNYTVFMDDIYMICMYRAFLYHTCYQIVRRYLVSCYFRFCPITEIYEGKELNLSTLVLSLRSCLLKIAPQSSLPPT